MDHATLDTGFSIAQWFETEAGIVATVLAIVNVAQLGLGIYRDKRHKEICFELGQTWVEETKKWSQRISEMRADTKEAFDKVEEISMRGAAGREQIAVAFATFGEQMRSLSDRINRVADTMTQRRQ